MSGIRSSTRLALSIGIAGATALWIAADLEVFPNPVKPRVEDRVEFTKSVAAQASLAVQNRRLFEFKKIYEQTTGEQTQLRSLGIVRGTGRYVVSTGSHETQWSAASDFGMSKITVEILTGGQSWGELQLLYRPIPGVDRGGLWHYPLAMVCFAFASLSLLSWVLLSRTFRYLNPTKVVPTRVRSALDSLAEGLVLINNSFEVVHSNEAFGKITGCDSELLVGKKFVEADWRCSTDSQISLPPWRQCFETQNAVSGIVMEYRPGSEHRKYIVNASPILGTNDQMRGVLVSFDDVTALESKKTELAEMIDTLRQSRDEVERQNEELQFLASFDPLTKCLNRRSFWAKYEELWKNNPVDQLNIMMVDIDHFKSINDNYGHSVGDDVLRDMGTLLNEVFDGRGLVCRYGGEEFAILICHATAEQAVSVAWELHGQLQHRKLGNLAVTASLGVSNGSWGAMDVQHMLDQADQCLYAAKRSGRNTVCRFDEVDASEILGDVHEKEVFENESIEYSAVTGLLSALAFRCRDTADHALRVADLSVAIGMKLLSTRDLYRLEICALLHDIGKIGVPDAILKKPGRLSDAEWTVMRTNDDIGVEIVRSAFASERMTEIIRCHHMSFSAHDELQGGVADTERIPLESRIITVCDAFDAMISDRVYRKAKSPTEAVHELIRCTPDQFDPVVVELLIRHIKSAEYRNHQKVNIPTSAKSAVAIGKHLESLYEAVADEDVNKLRTVVDKLKHDKEIQSIDAVHEATDRLEQAIQVRSTEFEQVIGLVGDVMSLCRSTRNSLVGAAESFSKEVLQESSRHLN